MARKFGGKFSPDANADTPAENRFRDKTPTRVGGRANALFIVPLPLAIRAFFEPPLGMAMLLAAFGLLILAAWLTREGLLAQEAYAARKVARRPAIPRKMIASALTGAGLFLAGFGGGGEFVSGLIFAILGIVLHGFTFGLDPLSDKGSAGVDSFQADRVARAVDEAERHLSAMSDAIRRARDRGLTQRVEQFQSSARDMFRTVEEDPRDLSAARKYLGVYLLGARDATIRFADLYARTRDDGARTDYLALLDDLEKSFTTRTREMLLDDRSDLDIEIEVLRERLQRDGTLG